MQFSTDSKRRQEASFRETPTSPGMTLDERTIAKALIDKNHDEHFVASTAHCTGRWSCKPSADRARSRPWK